MELSPFDYTGPLPPDQVRGRDELLDDLARRVTAGTVTALLGPRRFGKTSVLHRVSAELTEIVTIYIDLMPVQSPHDAVRALLIALVEADPDVAQQASEVSATLGFNLLALRGEISSRRPADRPDPSVAFSNLVDTLVRTALRVPTLVIFDEFQQIAALDNGTSVLRTALQHHYKDIGLLFSGSAPSAMRLIFANHDQPFKHQADIVEIDPLTLRATVDIVNRGFVQTGRQPGGVAGLIYQFTGGHPLRTMQAAHFAWLHAVDAPADQTWGRAREAIRRSARPSLSSMYEQLPVTQQKVLRILAQSGSIYGTAARILDLPKGSAQQALRSLTDDGHVLGGGEALPRVTDPFLTDWLALTHPL